MRWPLLCYFHRHKYQHGQYSPINYLCTFDEDIPNLDRITVSFVKLKNSDLNQNLHNAANIKSVIFYQTF